MTSPASCPNLSEAPLLEDILDPVLTTTLYDLVSLLQEELGPEADHSVTEVIIKSLRCGQLTFSGQRVEVMEAQDGKAA